MAKLIRIMVLSIGTILVLGACSQNNTSQSDDTGIKQTSSTKEMDSMEDMNHSGEIPTNMKESTNPKFPLDSKVILLADHMEGMKDAKAKIVGAYDTTIYEVSYKPTTGGKIVKNHKWVVQEELDDTTTVAKKGDNVILNADHMKGMKGAEAQIDKAINGTVYVVDYTSTNNGEKIKNHMWITEDELESE